MGVLVWASQGLLIVLLPLRTWDTAQAMVTVLGTSTGKLLCCYSYLPCMIIFSLVVINTFNQNEHVLLFSVNNTNTMQTFYCLLLGVSA